MRLSMVKSKNTTQFYVIKSYINKKGIRTSKIVEKLGNTEEIIRKSNGIDPIEWAKQYIKNLNKEEKENKADILIRKSPTKLIEKEQQNLFYGGYLFLQKIYYNLKLDKICNAISEKYKFEYNLNDILSSLLYGRILFPSSKLNTYEESQKLLEQPNIKLHQIYRALEVICKETDYVQSELYKNSINYSKRNSSVLYYDCTNYFFEIEEEAGLKQYGKSKENRPNPIIQMGLFMDGDGIPLAFNITPGNTNEQITLKPLEEKILKDFEFSKFIVCTDAGLASTANRKFNNKSGRAFITTQSLKKLKAYLKEWSLDPNGWKLPNDNNIYNLNNLENTLELYEKYKEKTFYKERWIKENELEQKLIVTYSIKYRDYQRKIRNSQIERANKLITSNSLKLNKKKQNDFKRFIKQTNCTKDGEVAETSLYSIDTDIIKKEEIFDGFYGVCTNLEDDTSNIIKINHRRWEIEESFRIMKSEFKARPVFLNRDERIKAHFSTCFLALVLHRFLEKELEEKFTSPEILECLRNFNFKYEPYEGYEPLYIRTDLTDALHDKFGFRTDYQITKIKDMKKIFKITKS